MKYLLDTCVVSELVKPIPNDGLVKWIQRQGEFDLVLSVMTLGEIKKGIALLKESKRKQELEVWLKKDLLERFSSRIVPIHWEVASLWGKLSARVSLKGNHITVVDGLIAATALIHDLVLVTRNTKDFEFIEELQLLNPWS